MLGRQRRRESRLAPSQFCLNHGTGSVIACHLPVASIEPPKERKRLLGPGDNLPGAFDLLQLFAPSPLLAQSHLFGQA
jgi:hypothetical protein